MRTNGLDGSVFRCRLSFEGRGVSAAGKVGNVGPRYIACPRKGGAVGAAAARVPRWDPVDRGWNQLCFATPRG